MNILFPFYQDSGHSFLINKWWFRALIVMYIGFFLLSIGGTWYSSFDYIHYQCLDAIEYPRLPDNYKGRISTYFESSESKQAQVEVERSKEACDVMAQKAWFAPHVLKNALLIPLIIHYILQFIFFTIIINFIVLGNKSKNN